MECHRNPAKKVAEEEIDESFSLGLLGPGEYPKGEGVFERVKSLRKGSVPIFPPFSPWLRMTLYQTFINSEK